MPQEDLGIVQCGRWKREFVFGLYLLWVRGDLYHKEYTNVREIIIRFEKGWRGILFSFITTFTVFTDSFLVK